MRYVLISACLLAAAGQAGETQERPLPQGWQVSLGAGSLYSPTYEGDDAYSLSVLPNIQVRHGSGFFASVQEGAGYNLVLARGWSAGPLVKIRFSRDEDGEQAFAISGGGTNDLAGLGDVGTSIEPGGFLRYRSGAVSLGAELRQAISGHDGLVLDLNASLGGRRMTDGRALIWSVGPRIRLADDNHNTAYFGVTPAQAAGSGLPVYQAGGGLHTYGAGALVVIPLDREGRWSGVLLAGYDRLAGDSADAPLVRFRGDRDQVSAGIFLTYTFD